MYVCLGVVGRTQGVHLAAILALETSDLPPSVTVSHIATQIHTKSE